MRGYATVALACMVAMLALCTCDSKARQTPDTGTPIAKPAPQTEQPTTNSGIPSLDDLTEAHGVLAIQDHAIPVTTPTWQQHTTVDGESLLLNATEDELAYALYQVEPPWGLLETLTGTGEGPLWLAVADFGAGRWVYAEFADGQAEIDLTVLDDPYSPDGYFICGVICPLAQSGRLDALTLAYDDLSDWDLTITTDENGITLNWNEFPVEYYEIFRSMLPDDPAPHHVGTVLEEHTGGNSFVETVPDDGTGRWVPENNDNGTPDDSIDDFPTIAPEVDYYYRIVPHLGSTHLPGSPEVNGRVPWGDRWSERREWPDTTNTTRLFGRLIDGARCTEAQLQWCAENLAGATGLTQSEIDTIRSHNPNFIALGAHHGVLNSPGYQNLTTYRASPPYDELGLAKMFYGNEIDLDGAYPYINRHESWFAHHPESTYENLRSSNIYTPDCYFMDLDSRWIDYLSPNLVQLLGEDCIDGWQLDGLHSNWAASPPFYQHLGYISLLEYQQAYYDAMFTKVKNVAQSHHRNPYIFANVWAGASLDDMYDPVYPDYSACDGIIISHFLTEFGNSQMQFTDYDCNAILDWQQDGKVMILQVPIDYSVASNGWYQYCAYQMVRGPQTYFYAFGKNFYTPYWYPMYTWDSGAPLNGQPESIDDLYTGDEPYPYLRRDFENGIVVIVPNGVYAESPEGSPFYEYLDIDGGGGAVNEDGSVQGTATWKPANGSLPGYSFDYESAWIMRPVAE